MAASQWLVLLVFAVYASKIEANPIHSEHILKHVRTKTSSAVQSKATLDLIGRVLPERASEFEVVIDDTLKVNSFKVFKTNGSKTVVITGSSGVSAAKGFYHYLKYFCGCHVSWDGDQLNLPDVLPEVNVEVQAPSSVVYYQNVCTWSYSFSWWTWQEWRRHIDWMAMQGITLSLAPFQEDLWAEVYLEYNITQHEIEDHLSGPGFFAWQRMGNIRGWGGPLTENFIKFSRKLQNQVVQEMRKLGMVLALPAFAGHLPVQFAELYPQAKLAPVEVWNNFPPQYASTLFLDPTDPLFLEIGQRFLTKVIERYGTDHIYFSDPFNEIQPQSFSAKYLSNASTGIYSAMSSVDPLAVWLLQGWMFVKNPFWSDMAIRAFLTAVPIGRMLVLDLQSEQFPQYDRTESYYGQPFIWCMLSNFGGTLGMLGSVDLVFNRIRDTRMNDSMTMIGTGITPEGINQNYGLYEFALEMGWYTDIYDIRQWFNTYASVRYGIKDNRLEFAWYIFQYTVYSFKELEMMRGKYSYNRRPSLKLHPWVWYNETFFNEGVQLLMEPRLDGALYRNDVVDLTRQFLQNTADRLYLSLMEAYASNDVKSVKHLSNLFLTLLEDIDRLLRSDHHFLLGRWLNAAKALSRTSLERQKYEYNARIQITLWGPQGQIVDYANKQWAGVVQDFFLPRWKLFLSEMTNAMGQNKTINEGKIRDKIFKTVELPFCTSNKRYPTEPVGDSLQIAREVFEAWSDRAVRFKKLPTKPRRI
ncbi:alpha-N-acetylglucosaminidase-like [Armigeres subalbatus]|uniref:alpha-N-acetylglucosaminidase-like n=1 Tax=Armigeres subalbatus TaxID=124917 RepID=UPI002ED57CCA